MLPGGLKPEKTTERTTELEKQLRAVSYGGYDSLTISVDSGQLSAPYLKRRLLGDGVRVMNSLVRVKWTNRQKSSIFRYKETHLDLPHKPKWLISSFFSLPLTCSWDWGHQDT